MAIYNNLESIRRLTNSSITSLIDVTNLNFTSLSNANLEFLNNINYDEIANSFSLYEGTFDLLNVNNTFTVLESGIPTFTIQSDGSATGKNLLVEVAETKRQRFTDFPDYPAVGVPGEIVYTGVAGLDPVFGEDFIGYLQSQGWVSLTTGGGGGGGGGDLGHKKIIEVDELLTIEENYQYWIYGNFTVEGVVNNYGTGLVKVVNLATGSNIHVVVQSFTTLAGVPITITHGLATKDFIYSTRDGNELIEVEIQHIDNNSFTLTSTGDVTAGQIVIQAKI